MENKLEDEQYLKDCLSIIYGENIKTLFNEFVFTWEDTNNRSKNGYLLAVNGAKLITERIDDVIQIMDGITRDIVGYTVLLKNQIEELYKVCTDGKLRNKTVKLNVLVITNKLTLEKGKIQSKFYTEQKPDLILTFGYKRYLGRFNEKSELKSFVSHS